MAQINLLKQNSAARHSIGSATYKILARFFMLVLFLVLVYYAWLFFKQRSIENQTVAAQAQLANDSETADNLSQRQELLTRQLQIKDLNSLVAAHLYWSQLFPELASATLNTASYDNLTVDPTSDSLTLSAEVPSLQDLDQYMQVFNLPAFNKYFSNVRVDGFNKVGGTDSNAIKFNVQMDYDPSLVQYNPAISGSGN